MSNHTINEHDSVSNKNAVKNIPPYTNGVVVHIYPHNHLVVAVEFFDNENNTLGVETTQVLNLEKR